MTRSPAPKVAIIGAGFISAYHVDGLRAAGGVEIGPLVGRDAARTRTAADRLGIEAVATDLAEVLGDPAIDAVVIATPDATHRDIAIAALDAGKAVLLQKPMAMDAGECRAILKAAERATAPLSISFMHRHFPEVRWLARELAGGRLGRIHNIRIRNATPGADWADWFYSPDNVSGGVVMQLGVHGIDLIQHLFGRIARVTARTATLKPERTLADGRRVKMTLEDTANAIYTLGSGAQVSHEMSYTEVGGCDRFRLEVYAEAGTVWLRSGHGPAAIFAPDLTGQAGWVTPEIADEPLGRDHHAHWLRIAAGDSPPDDTGAAGLSTIEVAETLYRAADTGTDCAVPGQEGDQT